MELFKSFLKDESGATAIEYTLIMAGASLLIIVGMAPLSDYLDTIWYDLKGELSEATSETLGSDG